MRAAHALIAACVLLGLGCGPRSRSGPAPAKKETAEDQVLRVAKAWRALESVRGVRPAPAPIAQFESTIESTLTFTRGAPQAEERLAMTETMTLRNGARYQCTASGGARVQVRFGRRAGEPAVEVQRPPLTLPRRCTPGGFPEPEIDVPAAAARFTLRGDQLVPYEPTGETRIYNPTD